MKPFKLEEHSKIKPGFTVPDGYFESFQLKMMQQIQPETKVISLRRSRKIWWYAAAAIIAISLSIPAINTLSDTGKTDTAALDTYFANVDLPDDQIVELLETEDIAKIKIDYELDDATLEDALQTGNIETYILN